MMIAAIFVSILAYVCRALAILIIVEAVLSWIPSMRFHPFKRMVSAVVDPLLAPLRKVIKPLYLNQVYIDFTPFIAVLILSYLPIIVLTILKNSGAFGGR